MSSAAPTEVTVQEARRRVLEAAASPLAPEVVALLDAADRVLTADLVAPRDLPPWDNSQMDGYAVRAADLAAGARLDVIETVLAGQTPARTVGPGQAIRIMTGAPMPKGADTVVPVESTAAEGRDAMRLTAKPPMRGDFVRAAGEDVRGGTVAIAKGTRLTPAALGIAASLGLVRVPVHRRPVVAILATGDELAEPGTDAGPNRIYASSSIALAAAVTRAGGVARYAGIAADTRDALRAKLTEALSGADVLLTTGGVSVGEADHMRDVLAELGLEARFERVAQRPGYPLLFGTIRNTLVFGLPGNPVSTLVSFEVYVQPALLRLQGRPRVFAPVIAATLDAPLRGGGSRFQFLRAVVRRERDAWLVRTTGSQSSGVLTSLLLGNSLILVPAGSTNLQKGDTVQVQLLDPDFHVQEGPGY